MYQAVRDATIATRVRRPKRPWYLEQTAKEARAALTPEQREQQHRDFIRRHGTGKGVSRG